MFTIKGHKDVTGMPNVRDDKSFDDYEKFRRPEDINFANNKELVDDVRYDQLQVISGTLWNQKKTYDSKLDFNGGWSMGEAAHHIGKKTKEQTIPSKKLYKRTPKHKNRRDENLTIS